ncbi:MAG: XrtA system polysaccharide chain length determinant [Stellaceae bacterium]
MSGEWMKGVLYEQALSYARQLWRYKWLSIGLAWAICAVGWVVVALIPPKYESSARVYVNADQLLTPLLHGLAVDADPLRQVEFLQRTLLSRPNLEQVVHLSDLDLSDRTKISESDREELLRRLAQEVSIKPQTANLISLSYRSSDPVVAKNVVQALLTVFAENSTGSNRKEMENATRFLDQQIQSYENQLRLAEQQTAKFHEKYIDLLPGLGGAESHLDAARSAVTKLKLDIADARSRQDSLQRELESVPKFLSVDAAGPQVIIAGKAIGPRAQLDEARGRLSELQLRFTDQHPDVIALQRQIAVLEAAAAREATNPGSKQKSEIANPVYNQVKVQLVEAQTTLASTERRLEQAEREQAALEKKARETPGVHAQAQDLDRDYAIKKKDFEELLQRREQMRIGEAADTTADKIQFRIIDPPQIPVIPAAPNQPLLLSGVFALAIAGAVAIPLLLLQFNRSFTTVTNLRTLGLPVLGSVSWVAFPDGRRRVRIQVAALCAGASILVVVYGVLLTISANLYRLNLS